jgi:hypothetical protein
VGQIYLLDNPLLREPLRVEHIKPRLLGHWGTTPGLNFIYAHLNRLIRARDLSVLFVAGPGHGGPGVVASVYLEGTYSEVYPHIGRDEEGLRRLLRQFSFPGGIPSHVASQTPGSIFHGLSHAWVARRAPERCWSAMPATRRRKRPEACASSAATSARARLCARSSRAARSTPRWASRHWRAW